MNYRLQCLTPTLVGDGSSLSPIDYMVWKNQVNVLDQRRIFRLLAKGPRLDNYLMQVKRADKLDFASWGGFAQNFAGRRIPFEHPSYAAYWERMRAEHCHIPLFASSTSGPYLPGSALRGALRTALVAARTSPKALAALQKSLEGERGSRRPAETLERQLLGRATHDLMKSIAISDSGPIEESAFRIFLLRTAVLVEKKSGGGRCYSLGWKQAPRGSVEGRRVEDATPTLAEMAYPGAIFEGRWQQRPFFERKEISQSLHGKEPLQWQTLFAAANDYAERMLEAHRRFLQAAALPLVDRTLTELTQRLAAARERGNACLLALGWGAGLLSKITADPQHQESRDLLGSFPFYSSAIRSGMPFPKTRRIVFLDNQPAALPGWVWLEIG